MQLLHFIAGLGLLIFAFFCPGFLTKRTDILFKGQEVAALIGLVVAILCVLFVWLLSSPDNLFSKAYLN